jgi:Spy/CpxP family protein refolding chaperone
MHGMMVSRHAHACGCGPASHGRWQRHFDPGEETGFGVRRPLRFLAWRLQLDDAQVTKLAGILNELKTERAQAAVDDRRSLTAFADAVSGESFDEARATEAAGSRVKSAERLQAAVKQALGGIHAVLDAEQRERLAYLIRTGALML